MKTEINDLLYNELRRNIPKLMNLFNLNGFSSTYGYADRDYWAWKVKDFSNATMQGVIHTLAIAYKHNIVSDKELLLKIIDASFVATKKMARKNGSLEEAFPYENSFCVTALVAFDLLSTIEIIHKEISAEKKHLYLTTIEPFIAFISKHDETHAIISNHLATAVAAILLWNKLTNSKNERYKTLLEIIYQNQSAEGWYKEYDAADPGYQTLCIYYLAAAYKNFNDSTLLNSIHRSFDFLQFFVHPDNTIGGLYGSRNTEVFYPGGIAFFSEHNPIANAMYNKLLQGIKEDRHILPSAIDSGNYVPLLNAYAFAIDNYSESHTHTHLPCQENVGKNFTDAGIYIHSSRSYYAILNYKKGGTLLVYDKKACVVDYETGGLLGEKTDGRLFSTQYWQAENTFENGILKTGFSIIKETYPNAVSTIIVRLLGLLVFWHIKAANVFKRMLVNLLMRSNKKIDGSAEFRFIFTEEKIIIKQNILQPRKTKWLKNAANFRSIHMASSGYNPMKHRRKTSQFVTYEH